MEKQSKPSWLERVEDLIDVLDGSTISELELSEGETEIIIRRAPGVVVSATQLSAASGVLPVPAGRPVKDQSVPVISPITGVYYAAASPTTPPFANIGDIIHVGQVVALIEAMKVFNEVTAEVSGRVVALVATNGEVVQKGDALLRVEPL